MASPSCHRLLSFLAAGLLCMLTPHADAADAVLRATLAVDRDTIYLHQSFHLLLTIDTEQVRVGPRIDLLALPDGDRLALGAFEELSPQRRVDGANIRELRRYRCPARAMTAGLIDIAPVVRVRLLSRKRLFIGSTWVETPYDIRVEPLRMQVRPLPHERQPEDFSGAVGQFSFDVDVAPTRVAPDDLVTLTMRIQGEGYLEHLVSPQVRPTALFKAYGSRALPGGSKTARFEQVVIPQSTNAVSIPALTFSYFDPESERYETLSRGPFRLAFHARQAAAYERYRPLYMSQAVTGGTEQAVFAAPALRVGPHDTWATNSAARSAAEAYADGVFEAAIGSYEDLLEAGFVSAALHANAASAYLMASKPGPAVLHYRRALGLAPRDRTTLAALAAAAAHAGLPHAPAGRLNRLIRLLRIDEWGGICALFLAVGLVCLGVAHRVRQRVFLIAAGLALLTAAAGAGSCAGRVAAWQHTDAIMMEKQAVRFAPYASAQTTFDVPAGALVTELDEAGEWRKIAFSNQRGWVPAGSIERVCPRRPR